MKTALVLAVLGAFALPSPNAIPRDGPQRDSVVVVQGLIGHTPGQGWLLALPAPTRVGERSLAELQLAGDTTRWTRLAGRYVEARGRIDADSVAGHRRRGRMSVVRLREMDPPGAVRRTISNSYTHRVAATLWVVPQKLVWRDEQGQATGVEPAIIYTLNNHSESQVALEFPSRDFVCFTVEPKEGGAPPWKSAHQLPQDAERPTIFLPKFVREHEPLPPDAAPEPGRYIVRASLCGYKEYELETEIEIQR